MKCPNCHKSMIADVENRRYICDNCGYEIVWVSALKRVGLENGYEGI